MAKVYYEVAAEILQDVVKSRAAAIAGVASIGTQNELITKYLSDEAIANTYKAIYQALNSN